MRWVAGVLVAAAVATAHAHGGVMSLQIELAADDPHSLYVMSSYGLMISHDDGCTFDWVCESNIGYSVNYVPKIRVARDGAIFATTFNGLRVSHDGGCSFGTVLAGMSISGIDIGPTGDVWAATSATDTTNDVFVSHDQGQTFTPGGLGSSTVYWHSVRAAASDPARVFATGYELGGGGVHLRRLDGDVWVTLPVAGLVLGSHGRLAIAAIAPDDPDVVYVVSEGAVDPNGDLLYRSEDGGLTFTEVYASAGQIRDVVVRDADTVIVTALVLSGIAFVGGPPVISTDGGRSFGPLANAPGLACLTLAPDGTLLGCGENVEPAFMAVARFDGSTWTKVWQFAELSGALACPAGTGGQVCESEWAELDVILGTSGPSCGAHIRDHPLPDVPPEVPAAEACCGTSHGPTSWLFTLVVAWQLGRRRRRPLATRSATTKRPSA
jgi:hypothetical protein